MRHSYTENMLCHLFLLCLVVSCYENGLLTCHAERQRSIHVGHAARLVTPDASLALRMTCPGVFFTACYEFCMLPSTIARSPERSYESAPARSCALRIVS